MCKWCNYDYINFQEPKEEDIEKDDFIMVVSDLMHEDTESIYLRMSHDNLMYVAKRNTKHLYI